MIDEKAMKYFPKNFIVFQGLTLDITTTLKYDRFNTFHLDELFDFKNDFFIRSGIVGATLD